MKKILASAVFIFTVFCAGAHTAPADTYCPGGRPAEYSDRDDEVDDDMIYRMIANDPTLTLTDYAVMYYDNLFRHDYLDPDDLEGDYIGELAASERFAGAVELLGRYDNEDLRGSMGLDLLFMICMNDVELDEVASYLDRFIVLGDRIDTEGEQMLEDEHIREDMREVMGYLINLLYTAISGVMEGLPELPDDVIGNIF